MTLYRPLYVEVPIEKCTFKGHTKNCKDQMGCWLLAWDEYFLGVRKYQDLVLL